MIHDWTTRICPSKTAQDGYGKTERFLHPLTGHKRYNRSIYIRYYQSIPEPHLPTLFSHCQHRVLFSQNPRLCVCRQYEVILQQPRTCSDTEFLRLRRTDPTKVNNESFFDTKHGIGGLKFGAANVQCSGSKISDA